MKDLIALFIKKHKAKTIRTDDLEVYLVLNHKLRYEREGGFPAFVKTIEDICSDGVISPVISRGKTGTKLYNVYRKIEQAAEPVEEAYVRMLLNEYHPKMALSSYAKDYDFFIIDKPYLDEINKFLRSGDTEVISINERSFELFYDEKWLDQNRGVLQRISITLDDLCCYPTYEPFFEYRRTCYSKSSYHILIIENKDTYYTLKRLFIEGIYTFGEITFSMLIYGEGDKILRSFSYINEIEELRDINYQVHYFGDIDPKGMSIFSSLQKTVDVQPFFLFYFTLLSKYEHRVPPRRKKEQAKTKPLSYAAFLECFNEPIRKSLISIVEQCNGYLPQEGLNRKDFIKLSNPEGDL